jgi:putative peptide zinc metalloprotease protein
MALWRKLLFVSYASISYVYRWVITFVILKFMATFLKPYKLEVISSMLAAGALGSMIGWPMYRLIRNVRKRGRLPDMKPTRVTMTVGAVVILLFVVFFLPLPVARVRETGLVQVHPNYIAQQHVEVPGRLEKLFVKEGQEVRKGQTLAEFSSVELDNRKLQATNKVDLSRKSVQAYDRQINEESDPDKKARLSDLRVRALQDLGKATAELQQVEAERNKLTLHAHRDGRVIGLPTSEEIGRTWIWNRDIPDKQDSTLFCSVGDRKRLRIIVPVSPPDLQVMKDDMGPPGSGKTLPVTVRIVGRGMTTWTGLVDSIPPSEARTVLPALSNKLGGPVAVRPGGDDPNHLVPQSQVFLVDVDLEDPDEAIALNSLAQVHIHCRYRSIAWWVWRTVSSTFDLRLM